MKVPGRTAAWSSLVGILALAGAAGSASWLSAPDRSSTSHSSTSHSSTPLPSGYSTPFPSSARLPSSTGPLPSTSAPAPTTPTATVRSPTAPTATAVGGTGHLATGLPPAACPANIPTAPGEPEANDESLVPGGATSVLLCEYQALNPPRGLTAERTVSDAATLARLVSEADTGYVPPQGAIDGCPADLGESVDAYFVFSDGGTLRLYIDMGGCNSIVDQYGWAQSGALVEDLRGLLGSPEP
jgi:hypothetical protein